MLHQKPNLTCPFKYDSFATGLTINDLIEPKMKVLDVGCSYGFETYRHACLNPEASFIGIDIEEEVIKISKRFSGIPNYLKT